MADDCIYVACVTTVAPDTTKAGDDYLVSSTGLCRCVIGCGRGGVVLAAEWHLDDNVNIENGMKRKEPATHTTLHDDDLAAPERYILLLLLFTLVDDGTWYSDQRFYRCARARALHLPAAPRARFSFAPFIGFTTAHAHPRFSFHFFALFFCIV